MVYGVAKNWPRGSGRLSFIGRVYMDVISKPAFVFHGAALLLPGRDGVRSQPRKDHRICSRHRHPFVSRVATPRKQICRVNTIPIKIPTAFSVEIDKPILKFMWSLKGLKIAKMIFRKKSEVGEPSLPNFKTYSKTPIIETVWSLHKGR